MIFYTPPGERDWSGIWSPGWMRLFATAPLILYPIGCVARLLVGGREGFAWIELAAFSPILLGMICFALIAPTYFQRINSDSKSKLDEYEIDLRRRAHTFAYKVFATLVLLGVLYLSVVTDAEKLSWMWKPSTEDHWEALLWGVILYTMLLPTTYLAWTVSPPPEGGEA
jgi:hypothetical protein